MKSPVARTATDKDWDQWRMKQLPVCNEHWWEQYIKRFDAPAKSLQPQNQEEQEFYTMALHSISATNAIWSPFTSNCLRTSFWPSKDHAEFQRIAMTGCFPETQGLTQSVQRQSANADWTQRCVQHGSIAWLETWRIKNHVTQWSSSKNDQDESPRFLRFYTVCSINSRTIQQLDKKIEWHMERTRIWRKMGLGSPRNTINSFGTYYHLLPLFTSRSIFRGIWTGKIQNLLTRGFAFLSMVNDIDWTKKGNAAICLLHAKEAVTGASWCLRQWRRGGTEIPTNPMDNGTVSHCRWSTHSSVTLPSNISSDRTVIAWTIDEEEITTCKAQIRARRLSSIPHWQATYNVFTLAFAGGVIPKMSTPSPRRSKEEQIDLDPEQLTIISQRERHMSQARSDSMLKLAENPTRWFTEFSTRHQLPERRKLDNFTSPMNLLWKETVPLLYAENTQSQWNTTHDKLCLKILNTKIMELCFRRSRRAADDREHRRKVNIDQ